MRAMCSLRGFIAALGAAECHRREMRLMRGQRGADLALNFPSAAVSAAGEKETFAERNRNGLDEA